MTEEPERSVPSRADEVIVAMPTINGGEVALVLPTVPKAGPA